MSLIFRHERAYVLSKDHIENLNLYHTKALIRIIEKNAFLAEIRPHQVFEYFNAPR